MIEITELSKVSYMVVADLEGRSVPLFPFYNGAGTWEVWVTDANNKLQKLDIKGMVEGKYYSANRESDSDIYLSFFNFMCKRAYWPEIIPFVEGIYDDVQNISASLAKLDLFYKEWKKTQFEPRRFVITEIEYLFTVCRSLYDLLQECFSKVRPNLRFHNSNLGKIDLPLSFRKMLLNDKTIMSQRQIMAKYSLPDSMADFYLRQADFFLWLREYRDSVSHSGKGIEMVIPTDKGFTLSIESKPFSTMNIWGDSNTQPHKLGSVKSLIAFLVHHTFTAIEEFTRVMQEVITFPDDISPANSVFIRGAHITKLHDLEKQIKDDPWYS